MAKNQNKFSTKNPPYELTEDDIQWMIDEAEKSGVRVINSNPKSQEPTIIVSRPVKK